MMHNSIMIRDRLREANQSSLHKERRKAHRFVRALNSHALPRDEELKITGNWLIYSNDLIPGMDEAIADVKEYWIKSGLFLADDASQMICVKLHLDLEDGCFVRSVEAERIEIMASTMKGIWAGIVHLQQELSVRQAPYLKVGLIECKPAWKIQVSQAPYGSNYLVPDLSETYLSNDAFRMLAHSGINGMIIYGDWLCYVQSSIYPELNCEEYERNILQLRDAIERAKRYGVQLFYVPVSPKLAMDHPLSLKYPHSRGAQNFSGLSENSPKIFNLCSSDPTTLAFHGEVMANLFKEAPDLGGLILIIGGESYYHCFMRPDKNGLEAHEKTNCPRCKVYEPEDVVNGLLAATSDAVHRVKADAWIMAWPYSAFFWSSDPAQLQMLANMPEDVALLSTIEKDEWLQKDGYQKSIWDYSIDFTGPAENLNQQAEIIKTREMQLVVKTETALGLECIQYPYMPCLQRLAEKWRNVSKLNPDGVVQSWMFFGMWGSRAEELGWWAAWHPEKSTDEVLQLIATRDFAENASTMIHAWSYLSDAAGHFPYVAHYFTGPEFLGPAHPFFFENPVPLPSEFSSLLYYLQENEESFSSTVTDIRQTLLLDRFPHTMLEEVFKADEGLEVSQLVIAEYEAAVAASEKAYLLIKDTPLPDDPILLQSLQEELLLCELIYRTFVTTAHTYRFLILKEQLAESHNEAILVEMKQIVKVELENTRQARHIFIEAPWLDLALRLDGKYPSSIEMIDSKIVMMEQGL